MKEKEDSLKTCKILSEKEIAILKQKKDFLDVQLKDTKNQLEESRKNHENTIEAMEGK
jgi:hypothetical protein